MRSRSRGSIATRRAHPLGELAAERVRLARRRCSRAPAWRATAVGHEPDRSGPRDEHVLAEDRERERRVDRVAERVEDRGDVLVDPRPVVPDVRHRQGHVLGEGAVAPDTEADRVGAQVAPAGQAVAASAADDVALAAHEVARAEVGDVAPDLDDLADELVADDERRLDGPRRPRVPRLDVQVRAADAGLVHPDEDVVDADGRHRDVPKLQARAGGGLHEREHVERSVTRRRARRRVPDGPCQAAGHGRADATGEPRPRTSRGSGSRRCRCRRPRSGRGRPARGRPAGRGRRRRPTGCRWR